MSSLRRRNRCTSQILSLSRSCGSTSRRISATMKSMAFTLLRGGGGGEEGGGTVGLLGGWVGGGGQTSSDRGEEGRAHHP